MGWLHTPIFDSSHRTIWWSQFIVNKTVLPQSGLFQEDIILFFTSLTTSVFSVSLMNASANSAVYCGSVIEYSELVVEPSFQHRALIGDFRDGPGTGTEESAGYKQSFSAYFEDTPSFSGLWSFCTKILGLLLFFSETRRSSVPWCSSPTQTWADVMFSTATETRLRLSFTTFVLLYVPTQTRAGLFVWLLGSNQNQVYLVHEGPSSGTV